MVVGESLLLFHFLDFFIRPLKEFMRNREATLLLFETYPDQKISEQNDNEIKVKQANKSMFLVDYFKNMFGFKSAFLMETEKEIALGEDIVETVRA